MISRGGKNLPSWLQNLPTNEQKEEAINSLLATDVFRSQFRTGSNAPKAPVEILNWGLEHIERMRRASLESRDYLAKSWQAWVAIGISGLTLILTILNLLNIIPRQAP